MTKRYGVLGLSLALLAGAPAAAQWDGPVSGQRKGEGALVIRDGAPGYKKKTGTEVTRTFARGEAVAGFHKEFLATTYEFFEEEGRVRVLFPKPGSALMLDAWMDPADLATFVYDCCDDECLPVKGSFKRAEWNACFKGGLERARASLSVSRPAAPAASKAAAKPVAQGAAGAAEKPLTNADVVAMVKAELGDDLVISKIRQAPREALDVSSDALVSLKKQGVSKAVLDAMLRRAGER
jgi:hypothetical protein